MAKQMVSVSDISGEAIPAGSGATISIRYADPRKRSSYSLDVTDAEADELASKGSETKRRGRKPRAEETPEVEPVPESEPNIYANA